MHIPCICIYILYIQYTHILTHLDGFSTSVATPSSFSISGSWAQSRCAPKRMCTASVQLFVLSWIDNI